MKRIINLVLIAFITISYIANAQDNNSILRAMKDEINRSIKDLRIDNLEVPYFIEYKISVKNSYSISGMLGSLNESSSRNTALLFVNVRVGDYKFDNSNFLDFSSFFFGSDDDEERYTYRRIPLDLDYATLRRELWLATDAAYKQAVEIYSKKTASFKNRVRKDTTADFTKAPASSFISSNKLEKLNVKEIENLVCELSALMKNVKEVETSIVNFEYVPETVYYANSEGTTYINNTSNSSIEMAAYTQAEDGMPLANFYSAYSTKPSELPKLDSLKKAVTENLNTLVELRNAPILDEPYSGPILLTKQAAAEIFSQVFVPQLSAYREVYTEQGKQQNDRLSAFQNKIGGRVLPEFLSVNDKPSLKEYKGTKLFADVDFDDQGIKAQDIELVKDGYLKNLLSTRTPTKRVRNSNGHARNGTAALTNMIVTADKDKSKSYKELKEKLISLTKDRELPYSIVIKKIMNANIFTTTISQLNTTGLFVPRINRIMPAIEAYKVFPDGREELIRGTELANLSVQSFKDIIFVGNEHNVLNYYASTSGGFGAFGGGQYINASVIVPDLLFEDAELKSNEDDLPKLPLYASPMK